VDDVNRIFGINKEHDLYQASACSSPPHQKPIIRRTPWEWAARCPDNQLGFAWAYAMAARMFKVPFVPSEIHAGSD
jgi:hypothetical protein